MMAAMYEQNYNYGHQTTVAVARSDSYVKPALVKKQFQADARPKAIVLWLAMFVGVEFIGTISLFSLRSREYGTGFNMFLSPLPPFAPLTLMALIFYCYPRAATLKKLLQPLDVLIIAGQAMFCYLNVIFYTPVQRHPLEGDINPLMTMLFGNSHSMQELYVLSNKISAASLVLMVLLWLGMGVRGLLRRKNLFQDSAATPDFPGGYYPAVVYQYQRSPDARLKAMFLWAGLLLFTVVFGLFSRMKMGIVGSTTFLFFTLSLMVLSIAMAMGVVFYCYPRVSTLKQLFRPLDTTLVAAVFFFLYLCITAFSDNEAFISSVPGTPELYNPIIEAIFGGFNGEYYAKAFCEKLSKQFLNTAGVLWLAIGVRGTSRRQAEGEQFVAGGLQPYQLALGATKTKPRDARIQALILLIVLYLLAYIVGVFSLLPLYSEVSLDEMIEASTVYWLLGHLIFWIAVHMSVICFLYPKTTTMEELFQPRDWALIIGQCVGIYLYVATDAKYFSNLLGAIDPDRSSPFSPVSLGFLFAATLLWFAMGVRGYRRRKASHTLV